MGILTEETAKGYVRKRILNIISQLDEAEGDLKSLMAAFDRDDVRQDDFYADAGLSHHYSHLRTMIKHLSEAIKDGGLLDEHFDREVA